MLSLLFYAQLLIYGAKIVSSCATSCHCLNNYVDCSNKSLVLLPDDLPSWVEKLNLNNNRLLELKEGSLDNFRGLIELKVSRNSIGKIGKDLFKKLNNLEVLELNKNVFHQIDSLTFDGLNKLIDLRLRHNGLLTLLDGAFWGLHNLKILKLDNNNLSSVAKGWLYGLKVLSELHLASNQIKSIEEDAWDSCPDLQVLDLSNNYLTKIHLRTFGHLLHLKHLKINNNKISAIDEGAFHSMPELEILELGKNYISWVIEDMSGAFDGLKKLTKLNLAGNEITLINQDAFIGLHNLKELNLENNNIKTIQNNAFRNMQLHSLLLNSESLLCDCHIAWFSTWLDSNDLKLSNLHCAYPEYLKRRVLTSVPIETLTCSNNDSPKPIIYEGPQSAVVVSGSQVNISCRASSSSNSSLIFKWRRNNDDIPTLMTVVSSNFSILMFPNVSLSHAGNYQCIVSNNFGTAYSKKANLTVLVMPTMTKKPVNVTVNAGSIARLECAAIGLPSPQVSWQKDGGTQFPAAQERRMHVMPTDDVFFIVNTKPSDSGLYSCIARNSAGTVVANSTLTVHEPPTFVSSLVDINVLTGKPVVINCMASGWPKPKLKWWKDGVVLKPSNRLYFAANNQLLIIVSSQVSDSGSYQCEVKNILGAEKRSLHLTVSSSIFRKTDDDTTGIIIIAVVCCAVGTSAIWVIIIYHSQKRIKYREQLKNYSSRSNHQDTKSELSASSKDSGTGDSRRSNENLHMESNVCLQEFNEPVGSIEAESPLMSGFTLVIEEDPECKDCSHLSEHQFSRFNHDRSNKSSQASETAPSSMSVSIDKQPSSFLCVFNSSHSRPTTV